MRHVPKIQIMEDEDAREEEERNYRKILFNMAKNVDKLSVEYEKTIKHEKKDLEDHASIHHEG